ncbi:glycoside hydrolase family 2 protein [Cellulosimicrobium cellulans]|uniref:glycoside hydrolase family 2 protein n=1 Tax=Cellulosimicrobium cellulans TaxID=1710 RepID=UPI0037BF5A57
MPYQPATFRPLHEGWTVEPATPIPAVNRPVSAHVPGEVHVDLHRAGVIEDPFDGDNESQQQWIGDTSWVYRTSFAWAPDGSDRHDLVAFGLDTVATVELNGSVVATTQNMHRTYRFEVRDLLVEGDNELTVRFAAPVPEVTVREELHGAYPHVNHHPYNQLRKSACSFGWDWGIDVAGAGIWRPIGLDSWSGVRIASVRPLVDVRDGTGVLDVHVDVERAGADATPLPVTVRVTPPSERAPIVVRGDIAPSASSATMQVRVPDAELWWPVGHGAQPLYRVEVTVEDATGGSARWTSRVGFRTVVVDTAPDAHGAPFRLLVNGELVLVRGANWIPEHAFVSQVDRDRYARRVDDALEANINLLRVWGGGIYESDDLYDLADEAGLLMWQDFPLACAAYSEDEYLWTEIEAEARENIARLSPHASLVIWNGNNENTWGSVDWGWLHELQGRAWGDGYYRRLLPELLAELDPTRFYSVASPYSFGDYLHPNDERYGTMHIWDVWNREDYTAYARYRPRFLSEFGFQGPPAWSTLTRVVHDEPLDPFGHEMLVHQKANFGNAKLERGWRGHLPDPVSIEDWHWTTQLNQAHAVRFGIEHVRSLTPVNTGAIVWQLNDNWPVVSWAAIDHDEHRKPLWYALRAAYTPRLATFQPRASEEATSSAWEGTTPVPDTLALVVVNDTSAPLAGTWTLTRETADGTILAKATVEISASGRDAATTPVPPDVATLTDPTAEILVATCDDPSAGVAPAFWYGAELVDQQLDPEPLEVQVEPTPEGCRLRVTATSLARDIFCHADVVDPAATVDNGLITLRAGEHATFQIVSPSGGDPVDFAGAVRCANDLLHHP